MIALWLAFLATTFSDSSLEGEAAVVPRVFPGRRPYDYGAGHMAKGDEDEYGPEVSKAPAL
jgi:hypothetical protein